MVKKVIIHLKNGTLFKVLTVYLHLIKSGFIFEGINRGSEWNQDSETYEVIQRAIQQEKKVAVVTVFDFLRTRFGKLSLQPHKGIDEDLFQQLAQAIVAMYAGEELDQQEQDNLLKRFESLEVSALTCKDWKCLRWVISSAGLWEIGNHCRTKAIHKAIDTAESGKSRDLVAGFIAAINIGDLETAGKIVEKLKRKPCKILFIKPIQMLYDLLVGNKESAQRTAKKYYSEADKRFARYIDGKTVAIVGPAPNAQNAGAEIDSFDIVIRLSYRGKQTMPPAEEFGSKANVSYYNNESAENIDKFPTKDFLSELDFCVFANQRHGYQKELNQARTSYHLEHFYFSGFPNLVPTILLDLLYFNPSKIKIFKTNFFLSQKAYYENYQLERNQNLSTLKKRYSYARHDVVSQVNMVRLLWKTNLIEADDACSKILELSNEEYARQMELLY